MFKAKISAVTGCTIDYGNNLDKLHASLASITNTFEEVIFVDWGNEVPIHVRHPQLFPKVDNLKFLHVPKKFTDSLYVPAKNRNFPEVLVRNTGIRRASLDWIVYLNTDLILSEPEFFRTYTLHPDTFYVGVRRDVREKEWKRVIDMPLYSLIGYLEDQRYPLSPNCNDEASLVYGCGDFNLAHRNAWHRVRGYEESLLLTNYFDTNLYLKAVNADLHISRLPYDLWHLDHPKMNKYKRRLFGYANPKRLATKTLTHTRNLSSWGFTHERFELA